MIYKPRKQPRRNELEECKWRLITSGNAASTRDNKTKPSQLEGFKGASKAKPPNDGTKRLNQNGEVSLVPSVSPPHVGEAKKPALARL